MSKTYMHVMSDFATPKIHAGVHFKFSNGWTLSIVIDPPRPHMLKVACWYEEGDISTEEIVDTDKLSVVMRRVAELPPHDDRLTSMMNDVNRQIFA